MSRATRMTILAVTLLLSSCTSIRPELPNTAEDQVDHFKIWKVEEVRFDRPVRLKGQFDKAPWQARIDSIQYLANPVRKNGKPIRDPNTHLVAYFLHQPEEPGPRRWVALSNQFGTARWRLTDPALLLVPAGKAFPPSQPSMPSGPLAHFLCYLVREPIEVTRSVTLVDQFDERREAAERITKLEPAFFCVPVEKDGKPITNPSVHLAIYDIAPRARLQPPIIVWTRDQFRPNILKATESLMLAVPSQKTDWGPDPNGDNPS